MKDNRQYRKVYYRIDAGYVWGKGLDEDKLKVIEKELADIFMPLDFVLKKNTLACASPEYHREAEHLYCHPMNFSGYIIEKNIPLIAEKIKQAKAFSLRGIDTHETAFNYTQGELTQTLDDKKDEIITKILALYKTKRRNLYRSISPLRDLTINIPCFDMPENKDTITNFVADLFEQLIREKKIVTGENPKVGKIYRTAN